MRKNGTYAELCWDLVARGAYSYLCLDPVRDRKKKKYVSTQGVESKRMIRSESGNLIAASLKSNKYQEWMAKNKLDR